MPPGSNELSSTLHCELAARLYNILYIWTRCASRSLSSFEAARLDDLRAFPLSARREAGHQLDLLHGEADDWMPMPAIGRGIRELRIREADGAFRIIYVA